MKEKWFTTLEIVDIDTGEIINKTEITNKNYIIKNKTIKHEHKDNTGKWYNERKITWECEKNKQLKLFN